MSIFTGSRYTKTEVQYDNKGNVAFKPRIKHNFKREDAITYTFKQGDRLDLIADAYYSNSQFWWVILELNPHYMLETDIMVGDLLLLPNPSEVGELYY